MKILDRYIRNAVLAATAFVSLVILGIQSFLELVEQFRHVGVHSYRVWQAFLFVPMQLPAEFYQLFPMAGFLGCLIGLGRLSSSAQLIVMQMSGVSVARLLWSVMKAALLMIVVVMLLGEVFGPTWQQKAIHMQQKALAPSLNQDLLQSIWLREGDTYTHIDALRNQKTITGVTRYFFSNSGRLQQVIYAQRGELVNNQWRLYDLKKTIFHANRVLSAQQKTATWHLLFQPNLQVQMSIPSAEQSLKDLFETVRYRRAIGLSTGQVLFQLYQRLLQPISALVMICLAVPFVFGSFRSATMGARILMGVVMGFGFYILNQLFGPITLVYQFPPLLAAITPTLIFSVILFFLLMRVR